MYQMAQFVFDVSVMSVFYVSLVAVFQEHVFFCFLDFSASPAQARRKNFGKSVRGRQPKSSASEGINRSMSESDGVVNKTKLVAMLSPMQNSSEDEELVRAISKLYHHYPSLRQISNTIFS